MADTHGRSPNTGNSRRDPSRLQRQAPASIQVSPASSFASDWKVAIPLLSPLVRSPASPKSVDLMTVEMNKCGEEALRKGSEKPIFKMWQHPAAPFCHEPAPFPPPFVPRCR